MYGLKHVQHLLPRTTYPCDQHGNPEASANGKYVFSFYFNGAFRKVTVDDRLPSSKNPQRSLYVIDRNNPAFLWPALIEKAYLKIRGGYDFPGSNSGTDLWVLTGWIPEQVFLQDAEITSDLLRRRLFTAFHYRDVLLTVGTGSLSKSEQDGFGLVSDHDYAILDLKESEGRLLLLVKNPWAGASHSGHSWWIDCEQILQNFENMYLNWNPSLFVHRQDIHFTWDLSTDRGVAGCFVRNPQVAVSCKSGGTVWLLLGKHFRSGRPSDVEFISIYVFKADGKRVCLSDGALHRGPYVDSPNTLVRIDMLPDTVYTVVISEQSLPPLAQNFSLSAFSPTSPLKVALAQDKYPYVTRMHGSWTSATAGGNAESARYPLNPQFCIETTAATTTALTSASILLETNDPELATHVKLFYSNGKRISRVRTRDIITDSGDYRRGGSFTETTAHNKIGKGIYTIVCSTFAPDQLGDFTLWISTTAPCIVTPLPPESAGRRTTKSPLGILPPGKDRMSAPLHVPRLTRVNLIAQTRFSSIAASPMLMTVELGQGPYKEVLASSEEGVHADAVSGIRIEDLDLRPLQGTIWIVVERVGGQVEEHVDVEALAEEKVEIGEWILDDG